MKPLIIEKEIYLLILVCFFYTHFQDEVMEILKYETFIPVIDFQNKIICLN